MPHRLPRDVGTSAAGIGGVFLVTLLYVRWLHITNATTVALSFLVVVLAVAASSSLRVAVATSIVAMLCFNFFFLPPVGTLTIADPQNWIALFAFLAVSLVASNLSSIARQRAHEAVARRDEMSRLFDLSRDVLLMTESREAIAVLARFIARRFDLDYVAIARPRGAEWDIAEAGSQTVPLEPRQLSDVAAGAARMLEFDARERTYAGHRSVIVEGRAVRLIPLRLGIRPIGVLAAAGRPVDPGSLDALAGVAAIAIERIQFLEERKAAELARQSEELKSALLASLAHDLRTPLTTIRVAASNLQSSWLNDADRQEQSNLVLSEVERLTRLFENILEMARIDAGAVSTDLRWVHPSEVVDAARAQVEHTLEGHEVRVAAESGALVRLDPRVTAAALAHLLENAAQYGPAEAPIEVTARVEADGLRVDVRDHGPGISQRDLPHLFTRFFRGSNVADRRSGTGMGLSIARGLLAAEKGRVWAENCDDGGARFSIAVPAEQKLVGESA